MNIGIVTTWRECGAAYVSRAYLDVLSKENNVFIYARDGKKYVKGNPRWDKPYVWWGKDLPAFVIDQKDFFSWIDENKIDLVIFNEQRNWDIILSCKKRKDLIIGAYIDYYTSETLEFFKLYDFLICNTKRHYSIFKDFRNCFYIPWGTDIELFKPKSEKHKILTFFHSAGGLGINYRKGTDIIIRALPKIKEKNFKIIIHSQLPLEEYKPNLIEIIKNDQRIEFVARIVPPSGLYYLGDIYLYPTRLEGIGLTIAEALSCGLPVITTDCPPMNEFVQDGYNGKLVKVKEYLGRHDGYYWAESIVDENSLIEAMNFFLLNPEKIDEFKKKARESALKNLNWQNNAKDLSSILKRVVKEYKYDCDKNIVELVKKYEYKRKISLYKLIKFYLRKIKHYHENLFYFRY